MNFYIELVKGLWKENPIFRLMLGMCPTLAVTTSLQNGLGMGVATLFVLIGSNIVISMLRNVIPDKVRIPCYIVVIATFVTVIDLCMAAFTPELHKSLGIFIPLIVVNCIILGRAEAFASKNRVFVSIADAIGMGLGFTLSLAILGSLREVLGAGTITLWGSGLQVKTFLSKNPAVLLLLPPGGFMSLGLILGFINYMQDLKAKRLGKTYEPPVLNGCRHCIIACGQSTKPKEDK
ncbi:MAG: electron transport complex subunit E [Kiritimatiellae bacterium]|jgi:electron transport complex protein RnfE|nr:electron transport complex subunit E [Kiritimatiellia bacterium]